MPIESPTDCAAQPRSLWWSPALTIGRIRDSRSRLAFKQEPLYISWYRLQSENWRMGKDKTEEAAVFQGGHGIEGAVGSVKE
jgi:hypothetical protein